MSLVVKVSQSFAHLSYIAVASEHTVVCCVQMQVVSLLQLTGAGAEARHLQSITQQLSQANSEIQSLSSQLLSSQSEVVSCYAVMSSFRCCSAVVTVVIL